MAAHGAARVQHRRGWRRHSAARPSAVRWLGGWAAALAASGPSASSTRRPSSSSTGTPSEAALSSFEPGLSPATTKPVFFETEPETLPPSASMAAAASSLV